MPTRMFNIQEATDEIEQRNRIRAEAALPLLSVPTELRKAYEFQRQSEFEEFMQTSSLRKRVEDKLLAVARRRMNNPSWSPTGVLSGGRWAFYTVTRKVMHRIWVRLKTSQYRAIMRGK
jgi:hypothetical protein